MQNKITLAIEDANGKKMKCSKQDRLLLLQAIQFNNIPVDTATLADGFGVTEEVIKEDIEHLDNLQKNVRVHFNAASDEPAKNTLS